MMATGERHRNGLKTALQKPENSIARTAKSLQKSLNCPFAIPFPLFFLPKNACKKLRKSALKSAAFCIENIGTFLIKVPHFVSGSAALSTRLLRTF